MEKLIAKVPILFGVHTYQPGDFLPEVNPELTEAWKRAGSCEAMEEPEEKPETVKTLKVRRASAPAGVPVEGTDGELVGKVPERKT